MLGVVTCSPRCSGEQESSHAVGLGRRRTGLPLCFFNSSSRHGAPLPPRDEPPCSGGENTGHRRRGSTRFA
ncbi:hypothetical protein EYF80_010903 [Liparis tanakae]|uniref:Uncharacterized protein n=1 Tax=Liparis tanakae TaxID=230148 RepID=A0A4Z2INI7_9TELE|nr:hypothetical protein EYF80_010903 [Liparis tanakae]